MVLTVVKCKKCVNLDCVSTEFLCTAKKKKMQGIDVNNSRACNYYQEREETPVTELEIAVEKEAPYGANKAIMERIKKKREAEMPVRENHDAEETESPKALKRGRYGGKGITLESIISLHNEGLSTLEISKRMGCTDENIRIRLRKAGFTLKSGGNGKVKGAPKPVEFMSATNYCPPSLSPVEAAFIDMKKSKVDRLKELLLSFTVAELLEAEKSMGVKDLFENVTALAQELANGKKVA